MAEIGLIHFTETANRLTSRDVSMDRNAMTRESGTTDCTKYWAPMCSTRLTAWDSQFKMPFI
ncbi:hypothetical protein EAF00_004288 [Botryotinia globosa]|nr:hypothetical protein EAF00_004288 [Botryotinia globosa]